MRRSKVLLSGAAATTFVVGVVGIAGPAPAEPFSPTLAEWSSSTSGTVGTTAFSVSVGGDTDLSDFDFSIPAFDPPGGAEQEATEWESNEAITVTFEAAVTNPAFYVRYLRGSDADGPDAYALSAGGGTCTWSIQSGMGDVALAGTTFSVEGAGFLDGILLCSGTVSSITLTPTGGSDSYQALTVATLEDLAPTTTSTTTAPTSSTTSTTAVTGAVSAVVVTPTFTG
jgi:hypothetical protein